MRILTSKLSLTRTLALIASTCAVLAFSMGSALAAHTTALNITKAAWNANKNELTIEGRAETGFPVIASNAANTNQILGQDTPGNNNRYKIVVSGPITPFPCRVHVEQDDGTGLAIVEADVANPPPGCTAQNVPPVCIINTPPGDQAVLLGDSLNYTGTATDADGTVETFSWTFEGGTPASSTAEDPGLVTYNTRRQLHHDL